MADKMLLKDYVTSIATQYLAAMREIEEAHPEWRVASVNITASGILKPVKDAKTGEIKVYIDLDEPDKYPRSEIPIPLSRME